MESISICKNFEVCQENASKKEGCMKCDSEQTKGALHITFGATKYILYNDICLLRKYDIKKLSSGSKFLCSCVIIPPKEVVHAFYIDTVGGNDLDVAFTRLVCTVLELYKRTKERIPHIRLCVPPFFSRPNLETPKFIKAKSRLIRLDSQADYRVDFGITDNMHAFWDIDKQKSRR